MRTEARRTLALLCLAGLLLLLCGCSRLLYDSYLVVEDYTEDAEDIAVGERGYEVHTFSGMKNAVQKLVDTGASYGVIRAVDYNGSPSDDVSRICLEVTRESPRGSYAVDYMTHSVHRILSYYQIEIHISYLRSQEELDAIRSVSALSDLYRLVDETLTQGGSSLAVQIATLAVTGRTLVSYVESFYRSHPELLVSQPDVEVSFYPSEDYVHKIITLDFNYHYGTEDLTAMLAELAQRAAELLPQQMPEDESLRALCCCTAVAENAVPQLRGRTAYQVLVDGQASPEGCAMAYQYLCNLCGIPCEVVSGYKNNGTHYWNIIRLGNACYHVDCSACLAGGLSSGFLKTDEALWGDYWWETEKYPECNGGLRGEAVAASFRAEPESGDPTSDKADAT